MEKSFQALVATKKKQGSAIAYALVIIAMVSILLSSVVRFIVTQVNNAYQVQSREEAFQIAESGVNFYHWYLAHQTDGKNSAQVRDFWSNTSPYPYGINTPFEKEYVDAQGAAIGKFKIEVQKPDTGSTIVNVKVTGWTYKYPMVKRIIAVRLRRPSWSEYSVLIDEFTRFGSGWDIKGKIMSNTGVDFDGVAHNTVYAGLASNFNTEYGTTRPGVATNWPSEYNTDSASNVFLGGKQFPYTQKDFGGVTADLSSMKTLAMAPNGTTVNGCSAAGCHFTVIAGQKGRHLILKSDGTFDLKTVTSVKTGANYNTINAEGSATNYTIPNNGIIFVDGDTWVEGTINTKRVTIVAAIMPATATNANIYLGINDIKYTNFDGKDAIGLIAQGDVETLHDGKNDLVVDAAILAQNGMIGQNDRNPTCCTAVCAGLKNSVTFFGSLASKHRLILLIGRNCASNYYYGYYYRALEYDNNMLYYPPPYFPTGTQYNVDQWEEQ